MKTIKTKHRKGQLQKEIEFNPLNFLSSSIAEVRHDLKFHQYYSS